MSERRSASIVSLEPRPQETYWPDTGADIEDVITEHVDNTLTNWAFDNGHRSTVDGQSVRCECGEVFHGFRNKINRDLRAHWTRVIARHESR